MRPAVPLGQGTGQAGKPDLRRARNEAGFSQDYRSG